MADDDALSKAEQDALERRTQELREQGKRRAHRRRTSGSVIVALAEAAAEAIAMRERECASPSSVG